MQEQKSPMRSQCLIKTQRCASSVAGGVSVTCAVLGDEGMSRSQSELTKTIMQGQSTVAQCTRTLNLKLSILSRTEVCFNSDEPMIEQRVGGKGVQRAMFENEGLSAKVA